MRRILVILIILLSLSTLYYRYLYKVDEFALAFSGMAFQTEQKMNHDCQKKLVHL